MKRFLVAVVAGILFGAGLLLSGMTKPERVLGFLDIGHDWEPTLAFVMMGAIGVHAVAYRHIIRRARPLLDAQFSVPPGRPIEGRVLAGAAIFGVGWGITGFCPGPALVSAASGLTAALVFVPAMIVGMLLANRSPGR